MSPTPVTYAPMYMQAASIGSRGAGSPQIDLSFGGNGSSNDTATYWIHVAIDDDTIYSPNISNLFPIATLNFNVQVVIQQSEDVVTQYAVNNEAGFLAGDIGPITQSHIPPLIYEDFALKGNPTRLGIQGIWSREFNLSGLLPYKIISIGYSMTIPPGASVQA